MCNELVYCPRLFHLEHVQGIFVESAATVEGSAQHRRAGRRKISKRKTEEPEAPPWAELLPRSLEFTSAAWGVRGRLDMVELVGGQVIAVEAKRGAAPKDEDHSWGAHALRARAWPADVAQLGLYMALLRDAGLPCDEGRLFYRRNRVHTVIAWTPEIELFLRDVVNEARRVRAVSLASYVGWAHARDLVGAVDSTRRTRRTSRGCSSISSTATSVRCCS